MASWSRCTRSETGSVKQVVYINLDQVLTVESAHTTSGTHTLIKFANERAETVSEPPEIVVCAIQPADERRI